jgi:cobalamin biosynthesis Mg chelatase CobN
LFAGQLQHYIEKNILNGTNPVYQNNKTVGQYFVTQLYKYGDLLPWEQLIEKSTGEPLNPIYFANYLTGAYEENRVARISSGRLKKEIPRRKLSHQYPSAIWRMDIGFADLRFHVTFKKQIIIV